MSKVVNESDLVTKRTLKTYDEIDGLLVIEELLLTKGVDIAGATLCVQKKFIDAMALVVYGLKSNSTNKLYVGLNLDRYFLKNGMDTISGKIKIPKNLYEKVKEINEQYKK